jgi:ATP-binding cassette, subfamily B, bacterial
MKKVLKLFALIRPYGLSYGTAFALLAVATALILLLPQKVGELIGLIADSGGRIDKAALWSAGVEVGIIVVAQAIFASGYGYVVSRVGERIGNALRSRFFRALIAEPMSVSDPRQSGAIANQFVSDLAIIQSGLSDSLVGFTRHSLFTLGALAAMFTINARMALITLASAAIVAGVCSAFIFVATRVMTQMQIERGSIVSLLIEASNNKYAIQAFRTNAYFHGRFEKRIARAFAVIARYLKITALINPVALTVLTVAAFVVVSFAVDEIVAGRLEVASLVTFLTYVLILVAAIVQVAVTAGQLQLAGAMVEKHEELLFAAPEPALDPARAVSTAANARPPGYRFANVDYSYSGASKAALSGASFTIPAGRTTALVGESGAGKSTIALLLLGLAKPTAGTIEVVADGAWADGPQVAVVPQNPFLFAATITDNIVFGRPGIDTAGVRRAAQMAQIAGHIESLDEGYANWVEENGQNFSRGQQQRIALARALAGSPTMLVLDEATASLDVGSERAIRLALKQVAGQSTILIIAHQGDLLTDVDHLIVLSAGKIVYEGAPGDRLADLNALSLAPQLRSTHPAR